MPNLEPTYLLSQEMQTGGLVLSVRPEAHFNCPMKCKQKASCKCLSWSPSISCLMARPETKEKKNDKVAI